MIKFRNDILTELIMNKIGIYQISFGLIKIGSKIEDIDITEINEIYVLHPLIKTNNFENLDYTIRERLELLKEYNGYIHLAGGLSCSIKNQTIEDLRIYKLYMEKVKHFTREEIISFHGIPDYELEDITPFSSKVNNIILSYETKRINFYIDPKESTLKEIYTGKIDKSKFKLHEK